MGAGEFAQWLALTALTEELCWVPSTRMADHNCLQI